jgi:hypothetical protein
MELLRAQRSGPAPKGWAGLIALAGAALTLTACGGGGGTASIAASPTPTPTPTPQPPAGGQFTDTGAVQLVATVAATEVTCSFPSLNGPEITLQVATADKSMGGYITLTSSEVFVRIGAGSGATYTQRNFAGPGVTNFNATKGAQFNAQLADTTPAGQHTGTIGSITAISGSVSCGDKTPGAGTITITGSSTAGAISGPLTSMLVSCPAGATFALVNGLTNVGSTPATVEIGGGGGQAYFGAISTASTGLFFTSSAAGLYTLGNGHVHWNNATLTQTGAGGAGHTIVINGDATCGT